VFALALRKVPNAPPSLTRGARGVALHRARSKTTGNDHGASSAPDNPAKEARLGVHPRRLGRE
jgi:hypothetical protein